jgi:hypothetical protein
MTAPGRNLGDVLLDAMLAAWRADVESVPFPTSPTCSSPPPSAAAGTSRRRSAGASRSPRPAAGSTAAPNRTSSNLAIGDDITRAGQPTAIHQ